MVFVLAYSSLCYRLESLYNVLHTFSPTRENFDFLPNGRISRTGYIVLNHIKSEYMLNSHFRYVSTDYRASQRDFFQESEEKGARVGGGLNSLSPKFFVATNVPMFCPTEQLHPQPPPRSLTSTFTMRIIVNARVTNLINYTSHV